MAMYRTQLEKSIEFAGADAETRTDIIRQEMLASSTIMNFERAASLKLLLRTREKTAPQPQDYRDQAVRIEELRILMLQKGAKRSRIKPFFFEQGVIIEQESYFG
jgi:excinuclease UvrABC nuclease subunit